MQTFYERAAVIVHDEIGLIKGIQLMTRLVLLANTLDVRTAQRTFEQIKFELTLRKDRRA